MDKTGRMPVTVVGREPELRAVFQLLDGVSEGPAVLAFAGEAGIGKTTVWAAGVEQAQGLRFTVLLCRPAAAEVRLSYTGLDDLLAEVGPDAFEHLPRPQRQALDAALLRGGEGTAPDPRAVAAAFRSVLDGLAGVAPVLVAVDDLQWLDEPTRRVVEFAVRRCSGPVATLTARRIEDRSASISELCPRDPGRQSLVRMGPLSLGALHHVIEQRTGHSLPRYVLARITTLSGGNPFFALELARSLDAKAPTVAMLPDSLRSVVRDRLDALAPPVRETLLVASALAVPQVDLVERALAHAGIAEFAESMGAAEDAGVVELSGGMVRFTHPLLASGVYGEALPTTRRTMHRRLSDVVGDVEERARHLALAAMGPDPEAVAALDAAAAQARQRGAPTAAAELLELAMGLGADDPSRRIQAAHDHFHANDPGTARSLLEHAVAQLEPGGLRAEALALLGTIRFATDADPEASHLLEQALEEATDPRLRCSIGTELGYVLFNSGRARDCLPYVRQAVEEAEQVGDGGMLAEALAVVVIAQFLLGDGTDEDALARALALEDPDRRSRVTTWPTLLAALVHLWSHRLDEARAEFAAARRRCIEQGADSELWFVSFHAIAAACWSGDVETAEQHADEMAENAEIVGTDQLRGIACTSRAETQAWMGRVEEAKAAWKEAMARLTGGASATFALSATAAAGMAELSAGYHDTAAQRLVPAAQALTAAGFGEPAAIPLLPDAAEALIALGRGGEAEPLVDMLEASGRRPDRNWAEAVGARCRGMLFAADGQVEEAEAAFQQALAAHDRVPQLRYDRARTLLVVGQFQRRRNQRRAAEASLTEAAVLFDEVGTARWAENARSELGRLGLRPGAGNELTPTEQHVAELTASGLTNREVAVALYVSPKTVEAHLSRVYRKLGIRSRAELGRHMAEGQTHGTEGRQRSEEPGPSET